MQRGRHLFFIVGLISALSGVSPAWSDEPSGCPARSTFRSELAKVLPEVEVITTRVKAVLFPTDPEADYAYGSLAQRDFVNTPSAKLVATLTGKHSFRRAIRRQSELRKAWGSDPLLQDAFAHDSRYREILAYGPSLSFLYGEPSGVSEGYTIGEHTVRVLELYAAQKKFYDLDSLQVPAKVRNVDRLMLYTLAFHDIGKSIAVRTGNKARETRYSDPLTGTFMKAAGFNSQEARLAVALVDSHQIIGSALKGELSLDQAKAELAWSAQTAGMRTQDFIRLEKLVYVADAGSYPYLHDKVFDEEDSGQLVPDSDLWDALDH